MSEERSIKPIETLYAGYRFRSRLEARWAVFLDTLRVEWAYEDQGYELEGGRYLPDFYIRSWDAFLEVKPDFPEGWDRRPYLLAKGTGKPVLLVAGVPNPSGGNVCLYRDDLERAYYGSFAWCLRCGAAWWRANSGAALALDWPLECRYCLMDGNLAVSDRRPFDAATQARFEFGETPR